MCRGLRPTRSDHSRRKPMVRSLLRNLFGSAPARKTRPPRAVLRLEGLEDRRVPAVTVTPINVIHQNAPATTRLLIEGDARANTINITSDGRGGITVVGDGRVFHGAGIDDIAVGTFDGADTVTFSQAAVQTRRLGLSVSLDNSGLFAQGFNDRFTAFVAGSVGDPHTTSGARGPRLSLPIEGGASRDGIDSSGVGMNAATRQHT